ncbi:MULTISPECIES: D-ribose pyranase [Deefgea]|uniref:D-ribose pyranase n=1 Tax=Deefgea chitinilytica TaxID=570276 RepID=A0ABS2CDX0_9NEIS|nr:MULTISPECIES: D-ribose pyranase [Deefgea]MBM5572334.1 D-ribose pyranase [Deefgea chitinilytica]MBM9889570.1 D-ribose pyranase [Deefgea sp. CFH1-16]
MKKFGHLNRDISRVLASMGHTDCIVIADCGLPIPPHVECIDLSIALGTPSYFAVLDSILADFQVERAVLASECQSLNPAVAAQAQSMSSVAVEFVPHSEFKQLTQHAKAIIRTGEASPYANIVLYSGVIF